MHLSHERAIEVFGFLADFAACYPDLCEGDQAMYRDLCRAALTSLDDEQRAEEMLLARGIDEVLLRVCREDVGARLLRQLRKAGLTIRLALEPLRLQIGPKEKLTPAISANVKNWKQAIRDALMTERMSEPALSKRA